jgi:hypothetical protein
MFVMKCTRDQLPWVWGWHCLCLLQWSGWQSPWGVTGTEFYSLYRWCVHGPLWQKKKGIVALYHMFFQMKVKLIIILAST